MIDLSIVIPLLNEEDSIEELYQWIKRVVDQKHYSYEIIFIDDGSTDGSWNKIKQLEKQDSYVRGIRFQKNYGKSQALYAGFQHTRGRVVITMDADLQDSPEEIPSLYAMVVGESYDLVSGWKKKRYDSVLFKNVPSKLFNWAARKTSGVQLHDFNCGLKAYDFRVIKAIEVTGEMHRYIPVLAKNAGFNAIGEKVVQHQPRKYGTSKFGMSRFINGFLDLITLWFLTKFGKRPMHFFGAIGVLMFWIGFVIAVVLGGYKLYKLSIGQPAMLIANNPLFYIALTTMVLGTQLFLAGFLGEMILKNGKNQKRYEVAEKFNLKNNGKKSKAYRKR